MADFVQGLARIEAGEPPISSTTAFAGLVGGGNEAESALS